MYIKINKLLYTRNNKAASQNTENAKAHENTDN